MLTEDMGKLRSDALVLPGGLLTSDGTCHRSVKLRKLTGKEEEVIFEAKPDSNISTIVIDILANCTLAIGSITQITPDIIRNLLVCDKDYLLLKLRQITFGDTIEARTQCPNEICKNPMEIEFDIRSIEVDNKEIGNGIFSTTLSPLAAYVDPKTGEEYRDVQFRLPTVGDQEEIAPIYKQNESKALTKLLQRCLIRVGPIITFDEEFVYSLPMLARREIDSSMQDFSPRVDLEIQMTCPKCGLSFSSPFDLENFFLMK